MFVGWLLGVVAKVKKKSASFC